MNAKDHRFYRQGVSLISILTVPFILQIVVAVGLVGFLSFKAGEQAVVKLTRKLSDDANERIGQYLKTYLNAPKRIAELNVYGINLGLIDLKNFKKSGQFFWKQAQGYPDVNLIAYYLPTGEGVGAGRWLPKQGITIVEHSLADGKDYTYATNAKGTRTKILDATEYFAPKDQWYLEAVKAGKLKWSKIYTANGFSGYVALSALYPFYDDRGKLRGAFSVDLLLSGISQFLQNIAISPNAKVFVVERDGLLIGNSSLSATYNVVEGKTQRINAVNSSDVSVKATAQYLLKKSGSFNEYQYPQQLEFWRNGKRQFVNVAPWRDRDGLDWLIVITIPESDFLDQISFNIQTTILLCSAALIADIFLGIILSRWITQAFLRLSRASQAIASGDLDQNVQIKGIREFQVLSQSFNEMAQQLKDWGNLLESRIVERTAQLDKAKQTAEAAEAVAIAANQAKSHFLANMSHELRTPLNTILGMTEGLQEQVFGAVNEPQLKALNRVERSGSHLLELINDILDIAKIESGEIELEYTPTDIDHLCQSSLAFIRQQAFQKHLQLDFNLEPNLPELLVDERRIRQVLINLLNNAVKFTPEGGCITLEVTRFSSDLAIAETLPQNFLRIAVIDTGIGITPENTQKLFQPFIQIDSALNRQYAGTGLGLSLVKHIVGLHDGRVSLTSELGVGSCFIIDLPYSVSDCLAPERMTDNQPAAPPDLNDLSTNGVVIQSPLLLLVDDDEANISTIASYLKAKGHRILFARNGQESIDLAKTHQPDLILMDIQMPGMDGLEATKQIRCDPSLINTPIIVLTALAMDGDRERCLDAGANEYMSKPIKLKQLLKSIEQLLSLQKNKQ